jgi:hypothetical protein
VILYRKYTGLCINDSTAHGEVPPPERNPTRAERVVMGLNPHAQVGAATNATPRKKKPRKKKKKGFIQTDEDPMYIKEEL